MQRRDGSPLTRRGNHDVNHPQSSINSQLSHTVINHPCVDALMTNTLETTPLELFLRRPHPHPRHRPRQRPARPLPAPRRPPPSAPTTPLTFALTFLALDALYYLQHRAEHRHRWLWKVHAVHHQARICDASVSLRTSFLAPLTVLTFHLVLALAGVPFAVYFPLYLAHTAAVFLLHTVDGGEPDHELHPARGAGRLQ
ncbi:MAG: sterol desaturase family protein [Myxococcaceae bacterium]